MVRVLILQKKPIIISDPNLKKFIDRKKWPPRSPDLNQCDYFLWSYPLSRIWMINANIIREIKNIRTNKMKNAIFEFFEKMRLNY
jgi:hypothetical protein